MKEILILRHHHGVNYYDVSTPELRAKAFLAAFNYMEEGEYYSDCEDQSELSDWKEELKELEEFEKSKKIPKVLGMDLKELKNKINELTNQIDEAEEERQLYKKCKKGDIEAIEEFMELRMDVGAESEDFEIVELTES